MKHSIGNKIKIKRLDYILTILLLLLIILLLCSQQLNQLELGDLVFLNLSSTSSSNFQQDKLLAELFYLDKIIFSSCCCYQQINKSFHLSSNLSKLLPTIERQFQTTILATSLFISATFPAHLQIPFIIRCLHLLHLLHRHSTVLVVVVVVIVQIVRTGFPWLIERSATDNTKLVVQEIVVPTACEKSTSALRVQCDQCSYSLIMPCALLLARVSLFLVLFCDQESLLLDLDLQEETNKWLISQ